MKVHLSFLLVGHTKFAPDCGFGLLKQKFRQEVVSSLDDMVRVVNVSSVHNVAQLAGREDGSEVIPIYDWTSFLKPHFKKIPGSKWYHHFICSVQEAEVITLKNSANGPETKFKMRKKTQIPHRDELPAVVPPAGLSLERQWYLYNNIREFCTPATKDIVCPLPASPCPLAAQSEEVDSCLSSPLSTPPQSPPPKRQRRCSVCGQPGHNA